MAIDGKTVASYLPFAIFLAVMLWRMKTVHRARPLRIKTLWILPAVFLVLVGFVFATMPPDRWGLLCFLGGIATGGLLGWQRARLMRLHLEGEGADARVMVRQSPAAILLILAVAVARGSFRSANGLSPTDGGHVSAAALYFTDALLGFGLGMVSAMRIELWRRARALTSQVFA